MISITAADVAFIVFPLWFSLMENVSFILKGRVLVSSSLIQILVIISALDKEEEGQFISEAGPEAVIQTSV